MLPVPLILGITAGVIGTKVGITALDKFAEAKDMASKSRRIKDDSMKTLMDSKEEMSESLICLGSKKQAILIESLNRYVNMRNKLEYANDIKELNELERICKKVQEWDEKFSDESMDKVLMSFGAYGNILYEGKKRVFVDSEIKLLSEHVEDDIEIDTNNDMLISGGLGVLALTVGGLGRVFAAPVLLIGGCLLETKASEDRAYAAYMLEEAEEYKEKIELQNSLYSEISAGANAMCNILTYLKNSLDKQLDKFEVTIDICGNDFSRYNENATQVIMNTDKLVKSMIEMIDIELVDDAGVLNTKLKELLKNFKVTTGGNSDG